VHGVLTEVVEEPRVALSDYHGGPPTAGDGGNGDSRPWNPGRTPQSTYTVGMLVAFAAISMFFLALVSASVVHRGMPGSNWVPFELPSILWGTSAIAILSSITLARARWAFKKGSYRSFSRWWSVTAALGVCFLAGQLFAWRQLANAGVYMVSNPSVSFFYVFTVAHGLHLLGGVIALLLIQYRKTRVIPQNTATAVAALYWHFVAGLWLFLFLFFLLGD
jgi:cytochrome c oxidase subunit III